MMNNVEYFSALHALKKSVDEEYKRAKDSLFKDCVESGTERKALSIGGIDVGKFTVANSKDDYRIVDPDEFEPQAREMNLLKTVKHIKPDYEPAAINSLEYIWESDVFDRAIEIEERYIDGWKDALVTLTVLEDGKAVEMPAFADTGEFVHGVEVVKGAPRCGKVSRFDMDKAKTAIKALSQNDRDYLMLGV